MVEIAKRGGVTDSYVSRLIKLGFLSPAFIKRLLAGETRSGVSTKQLTLNWRRQGIQLAGRPQPDFQVGVRVMVA